MRTPAVDFIINTKDSKNFLFVQNTLFAPKFNSWTF